MLVELENGLRFLSNLQYKIKPQPPDPVKMRDEILDKPAFMQPEWVFLKLKATDYEKFDMVCNRTMVGFVQKMGGGGNIDHHKIQCFYGVLGEQPEKEALEE